MTDEPHEPDTDEFDVAIARSEMNTTWGSMGASLGFGLVSWCCDPFLLGTLLAFAAAINGWVRLATMEADLRASLPRVELVVAVLVGLAGASLPIVRLAVLPAGFDFDY